MFKNSLTGLDKKKLRRWLLLFFFALAIPTAILIQQSYSRLKWETFHQHQLMADELASRIDSELLRLIDIEEQRSFTDYSFLNIAGDPKANLLQRSPLSNYPIESEIAGLIGYFQVDNNGKLLTPLLPESISLDKSADIYGIAKKELDLRTQLQNKIQSILSQNSLVKAPAPVAPSAPSLFKDEEQDDTADTTLSELVGSSSVFESRSSKNYGSVAPQFESGTFDGDSSAMDKVVGEMAGKKERSEPDAQIGFDQLKSVTPKKAQQENKLGRLEDLKIGKSYADGFAKEAQKQRVIKKSKADVLSKRARVEQNFLPERELVEKDLVGQGTRQNYTRQSTKKNKVITTKAKPKATENINKEVFESPAAISSSNEELTIAASATAVKSPVARTVNKPSLRIRTFESTIDPFEFSQLDSGHFVLFRNVWLNDKRTIQGLLIAQKSFLERLVNTNFRKTSLSQMSDLLVSNQGNVLSVFSAQSTQDYLSKNRNSELSGELLYQTRLSDPLSDLQLLFSIKQLPVGAGGKIILWLSLLLGSILCTGFYWMYRLGLGQINLANQQQDFVSAVSHELKTPLTSIRMYSEMLREGWANEEKKRTYYDFIFDESERLSRLINNVLHLARVTRNKQTPELQLLSVAELIDGIRSKVSTQIIHAGFEFSIQCDDETKSEILEVDADWFSQIMINLVDNAVKFSAKAEQKKIELNCERLTGIIQFSIRDFGPGVDKTQMKKIFDLFYRTESELTRETVGTGIGLALVHQMTVSMNGKIDVINSNPGAEFRVLFPICD